VSKKMVAPKEKYVALSEAIQRYIRQHGFGPTVREVALMAGTPSTSVANFYLDRLVQFDMIHRMPGISRGISIPGVAALPLAGFLPCGLARRRYHAGIALHSVRVRQAARRQTA
jgi:SOS-response transcriptional repressor LexA